MIQVNLIGRMGNNMFQYALGRIIHEMTGMQFQIVNQNRDLRETFRVPIAHGEHRFHNQEHFKNAPSFLPGEVRPDPLVLNEYNFESVDEIVRMASGRGIIIHGFFQRWKYYLPWREKIREWFALQNNFEGNDGDGVFHIRHGDYLAGKQELPDSYYESLGITDPDSKTRWFGFGSELSPEAARKFTINDLGSDIMDFMFMSAAKKIACSNSSFAWWAAYLSDATKVYIPQPVAGKYWSAGSAQDLCCPLPGWELIPCT